MAQASPRSGDYTYRMRHAVLALTLLVAPAATAQSALTEAEVRAFAARQAQAFDAGDLAAWFATFASRAVFVQQARGSDNGIVPYGQATVAEARAQLVQVLKGSRIREAVTVQKVAIAASGRGAALTATVRTRVEADGKVRESCAERLVTYARLQGRLKALSQTDTLVRCRRAA